MKPCICGKETDKIIKIPYCSSKCRSVILHLIMDGYTLFIFSKAFKKDKLIQR